MRNKQDIREDIWKKMMEEKVGRFPFPLKGRIPNFKGAEKAAQFVFEMEEYKQAKVVKVNPDSPQLPIRAQVIKDGKILLVPTPRLKDGFIFVDPANVPPGEEKKASSLKNIHQYGKVIPLSQLPEIDLFFAGSVALHHDGRRIGKGEGYADREYAILRELGNREIPVIGTAHSVQIVSEDMPKDEYDLTCDWIATENELIKTNSPYEKPKGIIWSEVTDEEMNEMPVLREIWDMTKG
ncbi:5-formyltetrahydrofolate cyclo-ligase [Evansella cellulosilytica]|uniref:5-formyltetrahydrofolate cyclo-ligase n=1 Tax=Evansella cellulosilytica (strain ATCC 21833 / DSM 2522 / FERM P-1141 / JCM 9156 / N-4) TaxID=649639 RepID=E6TY69_EVAC2|nr:5-formyltetrahydrofolate cyclo-ligase [Evansella cellulosilytica]ADU32388.1 5-formyltetrahydrofolate cyclo-ligase [Evansella cellulosilytica DSM 2522]